MDRIGIQDVFDPYYVGRKPFIPKRLRPRAVKPRKVIGERKPRDRKDKDDAARIRDERQSR